MPFGQQSGPPASQRQIRELLALLEAAGHRGFRDARGPMGFTQRQAGGKFTRDEADVFLATLEATEDTAASPTPVVRGRVSAQPTTALRGASDEDLAAELRRRGWEAIAPNG